MYFVRRLFTRLHFLSLPSPMVEANGNAADLKARFLQILSDLKSDLFLRSSFSFAEDSPLWIDRTKDMAEKLPDDLNGNLKSMINSAESFLKNSKTQASNLSSIAPSSAPENQIDELHSTEGNAPNNIKSDIHCIGEAASSQGIESSSSSPRTSTRKVNSRGEVQLLEQFEPGVYVNGLQLPNGTLVFKRIKFSKRRFTEGEAEEWWRKNQERVFKKYSNAAHVGSNAASTSMPNEEAFSSSKSN